MLGVIVPGAAVLLALCVSDAGFADSGPVAQLILARGFFQ